MKDYREMQLQWCLEEKRKELSYFIDSKELSLPEKMREGDYIEVLHLNGNEYTELEDISLLEELPNLKTLSFDFITTIKDFRPLERLPNLKKLTIRNSSFDFNVLDEISLLDELHLINYNSHILDCERIAKQSTLKKLSLNCIGYENEESLRTLSGLTSLSLRRMVPLANSKTLNFLKQFPKLEHLAFEIMLLSGYSDVSTVLELKELKSLRVKEYSSYYEIKGGNHDWLTIDFINKIKNLEKLTLEECSLLDEENIKERLSGIKDVEIIG